MKKISLILLGAMLTTFIVSAQNTKTITGNITTNTTFYADTIYTLNGYVFVKNNAELTIQPGTIIKGKFGTKATLVITRNAKINAIGTAQKPIVFTSEKGIGQRQKGDWGGLIILGKAIINRPTDCTTCPGSAVAATEPGIQNAVEGDLDNANGDALYGGTDNNHNSGIVKYVRVEFAGTVITPGNEINGITFGGVGAGTTLEYIQVSFADDDGFEWFGGNVNAKYLISFRNVDDDFDTDFGFSGKIQFGIALRDSNLYDIGSGPTTNGFESDNDGSGSEASPYTAAVFSNMTIVGPLANGTPLGYSNSFQNGARIRRNSQMSLFNSIIMGWPDGVFVDGGRSGNKFASDSLLFKNNLLAGNLRAVNNSSSPAGMARSIVFQNANDSVLSANGVLTNPFNYTNPDFSLTTNSVAKNGASFTGNLINNSFFTNTTYKGAIGDTNNWATGWTNFDPQNTDYSPSTVGFTKTLENINTISVYPNPASTQVNIAFSLLASDNVYVTLLDLTGKTILTTALTQFTSGQSTVTLNISDLKNGIYFVKINGLNTTKAVKLVIAN